MAINSNLPSLFGSRTGSTPALRSLRDMQNQMDRWFDTMLGGSLFDRDSDLLPSRMINQAAQTFAPTCDIEETDESYLLAFDLPGVKKEDIKIDLRNNLLTVSGERKEEREERNSRNFQSERFYGTFQRSFTLPSGIKAEQIEANYSDGVLRLTVPKIEETPSQRIKIGDKVSAPKSIGTAKSETPRDEKKQTH